MQAQPSAQLLQVDRKTLCGAEKKNRIHLWNIYTLIEQVNGEDDLDFTIHQAPLNRLSKLLRRIRSQGLSRHPVRGKPARHEVRMLLADAESKSPDSFGL